MTANMEVTILRFSRHNEAWRTQVLCSPVAKSAQSRGVDIEPTWANGAKIMVGGMKVADFIRLRLELKPWHVILLKEDVEDLLGWLQENLPCRQRPRAQEVALEEDIPIYTVERTFIHTGVHTPMVGIAPRSSSALTSSTSGHANPRRWRPSLPSGSATVGSQGLGAHKTLEDHADDMKQLQRKRDIHGVLQVFSKIKAECLVPDVYCYNIVINTFGKLQQLDDAERWFHDMESSGVPADEKTFCVLMDAYGIAKDTERAEWCMHEMHGRGMTPTLSHFNVLISAFATRAAQKYRGDTQKWCEQAEQCFDNLTRSGLQPSEHTFGALIDMYAQMGEPLKAEEKLRLKIEEGLKLSDKDCSMMMNAYANASDLPGALRWHKKVKELSTALHARDFTPLLKACAKAKRPDLACDIFRQVVESRVKPDHFQIVTLIGATGKNTALKLCNELGVNTEQAKREFDAIGDEHNFSPTQLNRKLWKLELET
ncbi:unnamed protein product [Durusdinium trenchii]|uniref:Pentatricopeptide repeat-containing protein n=2 Tax=Durusdinium trenchii TaxID=1381693 RepID=A0ABP0SIG1_9DINO